ncbi:MCM2/3/5 family-domain-containing protein [Thamnocephalis sphaerospora]|uniref:DNA replication licensing factor MCM4 n=1 Tax=Thamnocephalis sphaerospora TaxID=78915 RepID=A0A4P9XHL1_9FUNG|nr:MCM2/3/5 family-domain-containing protein [Thamnocephalis sphaerospora]|eukprot:RKP05162.1 MCM2/3/5 family-domain-containing protein [Thamnocephalis sphaerospora]
MSSPNPYDDYSHPSDAPLNAGGASQQSEAAQRNPELLSSPFGFSGSGGRASHVPSSPLMYPPSSSSQFDGLGSMPSSQNLAGIYRSQGLSQHSMGAGMQGAHDSQLLSMSQRTGQVSSQGTPRRQRGEFSMSQTVQREVDLASLAPSDGVDAADARMLLSDTQRTDDDPAVTTRVIWGTTVNIEDAITAFTDFLRHFERRHVLQKAGHAASEADCEPFYPSLMQQIHDTESYNLNLDCANLLAYPKAEKLYYQLVRYPQEIIPLMDYALTNFFTESFPVGDVDTPALKVRPFNLQRSVNMRELNPSDIDQLVTVKGLLIRSSTVIPDLKQAFFRCSLCENMVPVGIDRGRISEPTKCVNESCGNVGTMQLIHNLCEFADKQVSRLQETPDEIPDGQTPHTVSMCMYDDLVDVAKPGDRQVTGIYRGVPVRVNPRQRTVKTLFRTYLDVVHVKKADRKRLSPDKTLVNENEFVPQYDESDELPQLDGQDVERVRGLSGQPGVYELLARSLAPSIYEHDDVKKGILLQLFGGAQKTFARSGAPKTRGDVNILLVGDPSTSKSQLLQYAHKIAPRGVFTSGKGSSAVGLTAYVTRDPDTKQLVLESGALVLSDGGLCCIDEFDKMSDATRSILHEVMVRSAARCFTQRLR